MLKACLESLATIERRGLGDGKATGVNLQILWSSPFFLAITNSPAHLGLSDRQFQGQGLRSRGTSKVASSACDFDSPIGRKLSSRRSIGVLCLIESIRKHILPDTTDVASKFCIRLCIFHCVLTEEAA